VERATIVFSEKPQTMEKTLNNEDAKKWEITILLLLTTFCRWYHFPRVGSPFQTVFKIKHEVEGEVKCYKARLWQKISPKDLELIIKKLLHLLQNLYQFVVSLY
jgi:hypothetical protein